jgi:hypothetical protein
LDGIPTIGVDVVARLLRDERGGDDPADLALLGESAGAPIPTRTRFRDQDQMCAVGLQLPDAVVEVVLARANGAEVNDLGVVFVGNVGDRDGLLMNIHSDIERARLGHG